MVSGYALVNSRFEAPWSGICVPLSSWFPHGEYCGKHIVVCHEDGDLFAIVCGFFCAWIISKPLIESCVSDAVSS